MKEGVKMGRLKIYTVVVMLLICIMLGVMFNVAPVKGEGALIVQNPQFLVGNVPIQIIQAGIITGEANIVNNASQPQSAIMIAAVFKSGTNELIDVRYQKLDNIPQGATQPFSVSLNVPGAIGYYMSMYLWNNATQAQPLTQEYTLTTASDNTPPEIPRNLFNDSSQMTSSQVCLKWDASEDNSGIVGYSVYKNDYKICDVTQPNYIDTNVVFSSPYKYSIRAFDNFGALSNMSNSINVTTPNLTNVQNAASVILKSTNVVNKMTQKLPADSNNWAYTAPVQNYNNSGYDCRRIPNGKRMSFILDDSFTAIPKSQISYNGSTRLSPSITTGYTVTIRVTYFDQGTDTIAVRYNGVDNVGATRSPRYRDAASITKTNSGQWMTKDITVTDAIFCHDLDEGGDMEINCGTGTVDEYISSVQVIRPN